MQIVLWVLFFLDLPLKNILSEQFSTAKLEMEEY